MGTNSNSNIRRNVAIVAITLVAIVVSLYVVFGVLVPALSPEAPSSPAATNTPAPAATSTPRPVDGSEGDLIVTDEQAAQSAEIMNEARTEVVAQTVVDITAWKDFPAAKGFWYYTESQRKDAWDKPADFDGHIVVAEVDNHLVDNGDHTYSLRAASTADPAWPVHAVEFSKFAGVEEGELYFPNGIRMFVREHQGEVPENVSFCANINIHAESFQSNIDTLSEGTGIVLMQIGSFYGTDIIINGDFAIRMSGEYQDMAAVRTGVSGTMSEDKYEPNTYENGKDLNTDNVFSVEMPLDGTEICITLRNFAGSDDQWPLASIWFGSGLPETDTQSQSAPQGSISSMVTNYNIRHSTTDGLNVRTGVGTDKAIVGSVDKNTALKVLSYDDVNNWYQVTYTVDGVTVTGWVAGWLTYERGSVTQTTTVSN